MWRGTQESGSPDGAIEVCVKLHFRQGSAEGKVAGDEILRSKNFSQPILFCVLHHDHRLCWTNYLTEISQTFSLHLIVTESISLQTLPESSSPPAIRYITHSRLSSSPILPLQQPQNKPEIILENPENP